MNKQFFKEEKTIKEKRLRTINYTLSILGFIFPVLGIIYNSIFLTAIGVVFISASFFITRK